MTAMELSVSEQLSGTTIPGQKQDLQTRVTKTTNWLISLKLNQLFNRFLLVRAKDKKTTKRLPRPKQIKRALLTKKALNYSYSASAVEVSADLWNI